MAFYGVFFFVVNLINTKLQDF